MKPMLAPMVRVFLALMLAGFVLALLSIYWPATVAALITLAAARLWRWPEVPLWAYRTRARVLLLTVAAFAGLGIQGVVHWMGVSPEMLFLSGLVAAASLGFVIAIFEGLLMKDIFNVVPQAQRAGLSDFLARGADAGGKRVDFSHLDPAAVATQVKAHVIGQDAAVGSIIPTLFLRARVPRPGKPLAVFLLVGPTGVGKTETCKALADALFGPGKLIKMDCTAFATQDDAKRLSGFSAVYQNSDGSAWLPDELRRCGGRGLLLIDEVEKAHPAVWKALLPVLDEAQVVDAYSGTTYSATGFVMIMTSNLHEAEIMRIVRSITDPQEASAAIKRELKNGGFPPEFIGRIDDIFAFRELDRAAIAEIVVRFLGGLAGRVGIRLATVDSGLLIDLIQRQEKDASSGVRGLLGLIEKAVLAGLVAVKDSGAKAAAISVSDGHVVVEPASAEAVAGGAR